MPYQKVYFHCIFTPLKILGYILSVYMLVLSCVFCCGEAACTDSDSATIAQSETHNHHAHEAGVCSPFCICSCCAGGSFPASAFITFNIPEKLKVDFFADTEKPVTIPHAVWQPPKLAA